MLTTVGNTLEKGLAGEYHLQMKTILREAWQKTNGMKKNFWMAFGIVAVAVAAVVFVEALMTMPLLLFWPQIRLDKIAGNVFRIVNDFIFFPLVTGLFLLSIRHVTGQAIRSSLVLRGWKISKLFWNLILALFIFFVLVLPIGILFAIGAGIFSNPALSLKILGVIICVMGGLLLLYLLIVYTLAPLLIIERELGAWQAVSISIRTVNKHWFSVFAVRVVMMLLAVVLGVITLGIGLIWLIPMSFNMYGVLYREMVGTQILPLETLT